MKDGTNEEYLTVLAALGATITKNKSELALANYDIERLKKKLDEAEKQITELKGES